MTEIIDLETLEQFFADLTGYPEGTYLGVAFTLDVTSGDHRDNDVCMRITLPRSLNADVLLEARPRFELGDGDALDTHFVWSATNGDYLRAVVAGSLLGALVRLAETHKRVTVTDQRIEYGSLHGTPAEQAAHLDLLVRAINTQLVAEPGLGASAASWDGPPVQLDQPADEQPFFCYFCGATFAREVSTCGACGADLSDD